MAVPGLLRGHCWFVLVARMKKIFNQIGNRNSRIGNRTFVSLSNGFYLHAAEMPKVPSKIRGGWLCLLRCTTIRQI